jgi:putative intracellular protease/amidase
MSTKPVRFVVTSNGMKGESGIPTGFWLSEVTHTLAKLDEAGIKVEFASILGGEPPVDGLDSTDCARSREHSIIPYRQDVSVPRYRRST